MASVFNKIFSKELLKSGYYSFIFAFLSVVILAIHVQYLPPLLILWCLCWIIENSGRYNLIWSKSAKYKWLFFLFLAYYLWQLVSLIYTNDIEKGLSNLFGRLSLILFPFLLVCSGETIKKKSVFLIRVFAISTFIYLFFSFSYAFYQSLEPGKGVLSFNPNPPEHPWLNYFYSAELTISQHPSYISMYVMLSTFICFESWFDYSLEFKKRFFWLILGILLLVSQYFISSRTGIFLGLVMVPLYFIFRFRNYKKKWKVWLVSIILIICVFPVIINNQRVDYLFGKIFEKQVGYERKDDPRLQIWESTINLVKQNLVFGLGIGDARNELAKEYDRIGEEQMAKEKLNTHNQFLEVLLETGIIGLVIIMAIFFSMLKIAVSEKNLLLGLFIMIIFVFFQFETMLYRLAGVTFFSLFSFLLLYLPKRNTDNS